MYIYFESIQKYTGGAILGEGMLPSTQWLLVLQALQFCSNDLANAGVSSGVRESRREGSRRLEERILMNI